jgi:hypothetical protein
MMNTIKYLVVAAAILVPSIANAIELDIEDSCEVVAKTPDGFLALREEPGTRFKMITKLRPGELLISDTRTFKGEHQENWIYINEVPGRDNTQGPFTQGWVSTLYLKSPDKCD